MNGAERRERSLRSGLCDGRSAMEEIFARRKARLMELTTRLRITCPPFSRPRRYTVYSPSWRLISSHLPWAMGWTATTLAPQPVRSLARSIK